VKYYHLTVGAQGQMKLAKMAKKSSTYDITQKTCIPQQKLFFECKLQDLPCLLTLRPGP